MSETLRLQIRDAVRGCLEASEKSNVKGWYFDLEGGIADAIVDALGIEKFEDIEDAEIKVKTPDNIFAIWQTDDVFAVAKQRGATLTVDEARDVLVRIDHHHDANFGINWGVLEFWVDQVVAERDNS